MTFAGERGQPKQGVRRALRVAFGLVAILCFAWVVVPLLGETRAVLERIEVASFGLALAASILLYGILGALLSTAWWWLAGVYDVRPSWAVGYSVWGRSQWAKYLPTNTLHFVSRQLLGREAGLSHATLAASAILETASLIAAAALAVALLGQSAPVSALRVSLWALAVVPVGLIAWPMLETLARRLSKRPGAWLSTPALERFFELLPALTLRRQLRILGGSLPLHGLFFVLTSGILLLLYVRGWGQGYEAGLAILWVYPASWIAGTVTPGAPAGVGVREAILVLGLAPSLGRSDAAALALALRVVTTSGDALTALVAWAVARRQKRRASRVASAS